MTLKVIQTYDYEVVECQSVGFGVGNTAIVRRALIKYHVDQLCIIADE